MLGGLKLLLDSVRLFTDADDRRLPALLRKSRDAQAAVSTALAEQVLGALHELLRGLDAAEPTLIRELARTRPEHLYEGLLTVLMRLVFMLYAEDRDLLPSRLDGRAREIYETSYSVRGLYAQARRGRRAQSRHDGRAARRLGPAALAVPADPQGPSRAISSRRAAASCSIRTQFPFLEGQRRRGRRRRAFSPVSDGCLLRILEGLMTLQVNGGDARAAVLPRARRRADRLGLRDRDGLHGRDRQRAASLAIKAGKNNRTPVFVDLERARSPPRARTASSS